MSKRAWIVCLPIIMGASLSLAQQPQGSASPEEFRFDRAELFRRLLFTVPGMSMSALTDTQIPAAPCLTTTMVGETSLPAVPATLVMKAPFQLADRLAYYKGNGPKGLMGPRGWTCRQYLGSGGSVLKIAPTGSAFQEDARYDSNFPYSGDVIERDFSIGASSGRFDVARVAAHIFPVINNFVDQVKAEGADINGDPLPGDTYFYLSPTVVAFRTEPDDEGIAGKATGGAILGLAYLTKEPAGQPNLTLLKARLGAASADLVPIILSHEILEDERPIVGAPDQSPPERSRPPSLWAHNGSTVYLVAQGTSREFHYEQPRAGMTEAGARSGTLLFKGVTREGNYEGIAYIFKHGCNPVPYQVSGPILEDGRRVLMRGQAPKLNVHCQITGYIADNLEFTLLAAASGHQP
jgi:hypothetical protein